MRTPKQAYEEAIEVLANRHKNANRSIVKCKDSYKLGLEVAIKQLQVSFYGVLPKPVASTQEGPEQLALADSTPISGEERAEMEAELASDRIA